MSKKSLRKYDHIAKQILFQLVNREKRSPGDVLIPYIGDNFWENDTWKLC